MIKIQCRECGTELSLLDLLEKRNGVCICGRRLIGGSADQQKSAKISVEIKAKAEV